jgi:hypothetical protein
MCKIRAEAEIDTSIASYMLRLNILSKCKNNLISDSFGLNGGVSNIENISYPIDLYELQDTIIKNNSATNNGGAFSIVNSEKVSFYNVNVFDNEAVPGEGGAFYIKNSTVIFNTTKVSIFKGNKASGSSCAVNLGIDSTVYFNTKEGASVYMNDALNDDGEADSRYINRLHITGGGKFNLNETSEIERTNIQIEAGGQFYLNDNVTLFSNRIKTDKGTNFCLKGNNNVELWTLLIFMEH